MRKLKRTNLIVVFQRSTNGDLMDKFERLRILRVRIVPIEDRPTTCTIRIFLNVLTILEYLFLISFYFLLLIVYMN